MSKKPSTENSIMQDNWSEDGVVFKSNEYRVEISDCLEHFVISCTSLDKHENDQTMEAALIPQQALRPLIEALLRRESGSQAHPIT